MLAAPVKGDPEEAGKLTPRARRWKPILDNIEARFDAYLEQENRVNRVKMVDNRIHACLYFIEPTGHSCVLCPTARERASD